MFLRVARLCVRRWVFEGTVTQNGTLLPLTPELRQHYNELIRSMSEKALRCLAVAGKLDLSEFSDYDGPKHPAHK